MDSADYVTLISAIVTLPHNTSAIYRLSPYIYFDILHEVSSMGFASLAGNIGVRRAKDTIAEH